MPPAFHHDKILNPEPGSTTSREKLCQGVESFALSRLIVFLEVMG